MTIFHLQMTRRRRPCGPPRGAKNQRPHRAPRHLTRARGCANARRELHARVYALAVSARRLFFTSHPRCFTSAKCSKVSRSLRAVKTPRLTRLLLLQLFLLNASVRVGDYNTRTFSRDLMCTHVGTRGENFVVNLSYNPASQD